PAGGRRQSISLAPVVLARGHVPPTMSPILIGGSCEATGPGPEPSSCGCAAREGTGGFIRRMGGLVTPNHEGPPGRATLGGCCRRVRRTRAGAGEGLCGGPTGGGVRGDKWGGKGGPGRRPAIRKRPAPPAMGRVGGRGAPSRAPGAPANGREGR